MLGISCLFDNGYPEKFKMVSISGFDFQVSDD
jgi:hypothetical protein